MKIAVLGYGTVGKGVYEMIMRTEGLETGPVLVLPAECTEDFMVTDIRYILEDGSVDLVVEAMGGVEPAGSFCRDVLLAGKHLVTSNKAMVAEYGIELAEIARKREKGFLFSAACGGGVPYLHNLSIAKESDRILSLSGILNGTTNFILDAMQENGSSFEEALAEAKALGYAEADPSADLSGMDSFRKILLACAVTYGKQPCLAADVEGICDLTADDVEVIKERGAAVRLIASGGLNDDGSIYAFVEPKLIFKGMERSVRRNFNCASYKGENSGLITLFGQGAGRYPTASAVLRDITGIAEGKLGMMPEGCEKTGEINGSVQNYFVRCMSEDSNGFHVKEVWKKHNGTVSFITDAQTVEEMHKKAEQIRKEGRRIFFAAVE